MKNYYYPIPKTEEQKRRLKLKEVEEEIEFINECERKIKFYNAGFTNRDMASHKKTFQNSKEAKLILDRLLGNETNKDDEKQHSKEDNNYFNERETDFFAKERPLVTPKTTPPPPQFPKARKESDSPGKYESKLHFYSISSVFMLLAILIAFFISTKVFFIVLPFFIASIGFLVNALFEKEKANKKELENDLIELGVNI